MRALFPSTQLEQHRIFGSGTAGHLCEWGRRKAPIKPAFLSSTHREFQVAEERIQISAEAASKESGNLNTPSFLEKASQRIIMQDRQKL